MDKEMDAEAKVIDTKAKEKFDHDIDMFRTKIGGFINELIKDYKEPHTGMSIASALLEIYVYLVFSVFPKEIQREVVKSSFEDIYGNFDTMSEQFDKAVKAYNEKQS